jgi:membrane-associated phospholipid phosphatase
MLEISRIVDAFEDHKGPLIRVSPLHTRSEADQTLLPYLGVMQPVKKGPSNPLGAGQGGEPEPLSSEEWLLATLAASRPSRARRVLRDVARTVSTVCNPFAVPLVLFVLLCAGTTHTAAQFWYRFSICAVFTSIGPMLFLLWLYATERVTDLDISEREERAKVFTTFVVFYLCGTLVLFLTQAPAILTASMAGYTAAAFVVQQITRHWKISTHAVGITAPLVALMYLYGEEPLPFLVLIPLVGWSRVYLKAHTLAQVFAGIALGALSVVVFFRIFHVG